MLDFAHRNVPKVHALPRDPASVNAADSSDSRMVTFTAALRRGDPHSRSRMFLRRADSAGSARSCSRIQARRDSIPLDWTSSAPKLSESAQSTIRSVASCSWSGFLRSMSPSASRSDRARAGSLGSDFRACARSILASDSGVCAPLTCSDLWGSRLSGILNLSGGSIFTVFPFAISRPSTLLIRGFGPGVARNRLGPTKSFIDDAPTIGMIGREPRTRPSCSWMNRVSGRSPIREDPI